MDKRRSPRYAISLSALVHPDEGRSWLCLIRDFCTGGMLLVAKEDGRHEMPPIEEGSDVGLHFSVPGDEDDQHFRLEGRIVRVMDSGVGINFPEGMSDEAMTALLDFTNLYPFDDFGDEYDDEEDEAESPAQAEPPVDEAPAEAAGTAAPSRQGGSSRRGADLATSAKRPQRRGKTLDLKSPRAAQEATDEGASAATSTHTFKTRGGISQADAAKVVAACRTAVSKVLPEMGTAFFQYMDNELLVLARDAKSNAEQSDFFAAMSVLEKAKKSVSQAFVDEVLDQIDNPRDLEALLEERRKAEEERKQKQESNKRIKLSLVNTDDFEDWLAVANIISRSERVYERYLTEIRTRLGMLVDSWAHAEANPLGTAVFCHAFDSAIREVDLNKDIKQKVYTGYEAKVVPILRKLYVTVTKQLEESDVFPDVDEDYVAPTPQPNTGRDDGADEDEDEPEVPDEANEDEVEKAEQASADDADEPAEDEVDLEEELRSEIRRLRARRAKRSGRPRERAGGERARRRSGQVGGRRASDAGPGFGRRAEDRDAMAGIYDTVRTLMNLHSPPEDPGDYDDAAGVFELDEVHDMLSALEAEARSSEQRLPVRQRLIEASHQPGGKRIAPELVQGMQVVENLVDTIEQDNIVTGTAKDWIRKLEVTLDKVATQESTFLDVENPHESVEVLNQLAQLGSAESGAIKRNVDQIVEQIYADYDSNPGVFEEATQKLQPLLDRQSRAFTGNVQRTVKASEGRQTLTNAQQAVVTELDDRLAGHQIPETLLRLLMPGWRNLLVNTHLRQGHESRDWKRQLNVVDQLTNHLDPGVEAVGQPGYMEPETLLDEIESGLESIAFEPGQRAPLMASLREQLLTPEAAAEVTLIPIEGESVAETLGFGDVQQREEHRAALRDEHEGNSDWAIQLNKARRLHVGDWVEIHDSPEETQIAIIAWTSEANQNLVFVNRRGVKTHELSVEELTTMLMADEVRVLEEHDIPLTDRASHQMLQDMHNQLTHQATHDELTGLINRKEFERTLELALNDAKAQDATHIVAYLDLDQFKVINNTCGHSAGDQLLCEIAILLGEGLPDENVVLSRLGGDEYGILLREHTKERGLEIIRKQAEAIKAFRFDWEGQQFSLTTSCGLLQLDREMENVSSILSAADAACYAAKDAGRDRIQVYEADDTELADRRGVMEFVSQIDKALEEDPFVLNCQMISPIDNKADEEPHYEILLTVLDEHGEPLPPQDFIIAAETYNRMGLIDRWVIKNAFKWIAANILQLEGLGAFSINLSGNSLTEDDFMEFVLEQFNATRLPTSMICFEITETSAIGSLDTAIDFMERMKVIGVEFSLDDFGTGLSSYSYLRSLPVDYLKIDGVFVKDIKTNANDYAVVKSINEIGHFMGKKTIAEYVEDDEILEILREIGVDFAQGYGIGGKIPLTQLIS